MASNIKVGSTITLNTARLKILDRAQMMALSETADALIGDIKDNALMPFDDGTMQNENTFVDDHDRIRGRVRIISSMPYARRLYFHPEYNFRTGHNANAGGKWWQSYINGSNSGKAKAFYRSFFKKQGGI